MIKRKTILFLDNTYPEPYQLATLEEKAIGGTEASIVRTALILSSRHRVFVAQKFRSQPHKENTNLSFVPKTEIKNINPDVIIVLRKFNQIKKLRKLFANAKIYLWIHTYKNYEYVFKKAGLTSNNTEIICNSGTHKIHTSQLLNKTIMAKLLSFFYGHSKVHYCYNPIDNQKLSELQKDKNKLLYFSSPNKGLNQVLRKFKQVRKALPDLKLYIANPGYKENNNDLLQDNIINLGSLPHNEMMQHVQESLCIFYPQDTFAETFGLIYAEANAHGTAVIAHNIGSAVEILDTNNPPIDTNDIELLLETIIKWQKVYPKISYNEKFSDKSILNQWQQLLEKQHNYST